MGIQHKIMVMNSYRNLNSHRVALAKNMEKLSSDYKITMLAQVSQVSQGVL